MRRAALSACLLVAMTASLVRAEVEEVERYDSLRGITLGADAVVLGRVRSVEPGRIFSSCGYAAATVDVEALLAGDLPAGSRDQLTLEYFGFCSTLPELGEEIPRGRAVFFLRNKGEETRVVRPGATDQEIASESAFWRTVILAGTVVDHDGSVDVPVGLNAPFLVALKGSSFPEFVDRVRVIAAGAPDTSAQPEEMGDRRGSVGVLATAAMVVLSMLLIRRRLREALALKPA